MNKAIYLGTTYKCSACKLQEYIISTAIKDCKDIELKVCDFSELPNWIKEQIQLTDFPVTIFTEDDKVIHYFVGTKSVKKFNQLRDTINY